MPIGIGIGLGFSAPVAASGGGLGPELLTNGSFTTDSGWTLDSGDLPMTISGGELHGPGVGQSDSAYASQTISDPGAGTYRVVYTITSISEGNVFFQFDGANDSTTRTTAGTFSQDIVLASGFTEVRFYLNAGGDAAIDNASLKAVL